MNTMTDCKDCRSHLPDLLLEPEYAAAYPKLEAHLAACSACRLELDELRATFALLDGWEAPEPSPFFDSRLKARLREAQAAEPAGFLERARSWWMFSSGRSLRPALAGALALVMIAAGGGTFIGLHNGQPAAAVPQTSATVNDLKILDNNAQAMQQMDQLLDNSGSDDATAPADGPST